MVVKDAVAEEPSLKQEAFSYFFTGFPSIELSNSSNLLVAAALARQLCWVGNLKSELHSLLLSQRLIE